jgi:hypothetical protein
VIFGEFLDLKQQPPSLPHWVESPTYQQHLASPFSTASSFSRQKHKEEKIKTFTFALEKQQQQHEEKS